MNLWIPIIFYLAWVGFNSFFSGIIKKAISHPKYSLPIYSDDLYSTKILFIGLPILLFRKRIRRKRVKEFVNYVEQHKKSLVDFGVINGIMFDVNFTLEEYEEMHRYLKLEEITRKIKKK